MILRSACRQCREQGLIHPDSDHLTGTVTDRRAASPAESLHRVAPLCLLGPGLNLLLGDGLTVNRFSRHTPIVLQNGTWSAGTARVFDIECFPCLLLNATG